MTGAFEGSKPGVSNQVLVNECVLLRQDDLLDVKATVRVSSHSLENPSHTRFYLCAASGTCQGRELTPTPVRHDRLPFTRNRATESKASLDVLLK